MLKRYQKPVLFTGLGVTFFSLSAIIATQAFPHLLDNVPFIGQGHSPIGLPPWLGGPAKENSVLALANLPPAQRAKPLQAIANGPASTERNQARYLLATDLIQQDRGGAALPLLDGLERDYPLLAPEILAKRAQAYRAKGDNAKATATWQSLLKQYPQAPASVEALFALGQTNPQCWDQAIARFPAHPRTQAIIGTRLAENPNQPQLLLLVARHGFFLKNQTTFLDRLQTEYAAQLQPQDWAAIGLAYWEKEQYGNAGAAYERAPTPPLHLYRAARGAQLGGRSTDAVRLYQRLVQAYPQAEETGLALRRLADLAPTSEAAIAYLDQAINRFPNQAPDALLSKSQVLQKQLSSPEAALRVRQTLLAQHSKSDAAAEVRWQQAEQYFAKGDVKAAWQWAQQLAQENPGSEYAPEASFWVGKWATQLGRSQDAQEAFKFVLANYPDSYYAWRSASLLGWDVGDFATVRQKLPEVVRPRERSTLPVGSEVLQELHRLGQDRDAWNLWQIEFRNRVEPTVAEQYTDGIMRLGVNDNLNGIWMLTNLAEREKPNEKTQYEALQRQSEFWQALYPFPYLETIDSWAQQRRLNPMLVTALIRQESRFEAQIRSVADAVGLMQIIPETAAYIAEQINEKKYNLENPTDNIKMGTWYLDYTHREYSNNSLFAVASYNAGPGAVADWIKQFGVSDPDRFIEQIPYAETKGYVESVFGNYWNYLRLYNPEILRQLAEHSPKHAAIVNSQ
jgi:soluble lytic murein transglycosylase